MRKYTPKEALLKMNMSDSDSAIKNFSNYYNKNTTNNVKYEDHYLESLLYNELIEIRFYMIKDTQLLSIMNNYINATFGQKRLIHVYPEWYI